MNFEDAIKEYTEASKGAKLPYLIGVTCNYMMNERHAYLTVEEDGTITKRFLESFRVPYERVCAGFVVGYEVGNRKTPYIVDGTEDQHDWRMGMLTSTEFRIVADYEKH